MRDITLVVPDLVFTDIDEKRNRIMDWKIRIDTAPAVEAELAARASS